MEFNFKLIFYMNAFIAIWKDFVVNE
jgi:hypothetical protein